MKLATALMTLMLSMTPAMAIDFTQTIMGPDGPITDRDGKPIEKQPTLGSICEGALNAQFADERNSQTGVELIDGTEKYNRWKLGQKIHDGKDVTLSAEEISKIKLLVGKAYLPSIVGPVWHILDPGLK